MNEKIDKKISDPFYSDEYWDGFTNEEIEDLEKRNKIPNHLKKKYDRQGTNCYYCNRIFDDNQLKNGFCKECHKMISEEEKLYKDGEDRKLEDWEVTEEFDNEEFQEFDPLREKKGKYEFNGKILMHKKVYLDITTMFRELKNLEGMAYLLIKQQGKNAIIYDYHIPKQDVSGGEVEPDFKELEKWLVGLDDTRRKHFIGWAHSHNTMGCFWSPKDDEYANNLTTTFNRMNPKNFLNIVYSFPDRKNKEVDYLARFDINTLFGRVTIENLDIEIIDPEDHDEKYWTNYEKKCVNKMWKVIEKNVSQIVYEKPKKKKGKKWDEDKLLGVEEENNNINSYELRLEKYNYFNKKWFGY
jgi:hypothetical protein